MSIIMNYSSLLTADFQNHLFLLLIISLLILLALSRCVICDIVREFVEKK